jgi:hypothetical protein
MSNGRPPAAEPAHLSAVLRAKVSDVMVEKDIPTILSRIIHLRLVYDDPAADLPATLILKTGLPRTMQPDWNDGRDEVAFYTRIAPALQGGIVPHCYEAHHDPASGAWHLLLENLSDTHALPTQWPLPPTQAQCEMILNARSQLHAAWWDHPGLGVAAGERACAKSLEAYLGRVERALATVSDRLGDELSERRALFERFIQAAPKLSP